MTFSSPFIRLSLCHATAQAAQLHRYFKLVTSLQRVNEPWQTSATIRALSQGAIHLARRDDRVGIRSPHPVHRATDIAIRDRHAVTNHHVVSPRVLVAGQCRVALAGSGN